MAKKKTGIGIQALFEEVPRESGSAKEETILPGREAESPSSETKDGGVNLAPETVKRLEATCQFVSWLIDKTVSQEMVAEAAIKIALENLEAEGKKSRLVQEILAKLGHVRTEHVSLVGQPTQVQPLA